MKTLLKLTTLISLIMMMMQCGQDLSSKKSSQILSVNDNSGLMASPNYFWGASKHGCYKSYGRVVYGSCRIPTDEQINEIANELIQQAPLRTAYFQKRKTDYQNYITGLRSQAEEAEMSAGNNLFSDLYRKVAVEMEEYIEEQGSVSDEVIDMVGPQSPLLDQLENLRVFLKNYQQRVDGEQDPAIKEVLNQSRNRAYYNFIEEGEFGRVYFQYWKVNELIKEEAKDSSLELIGRWGGWSSHGTLSLVDYLNIDEDSCTEASTHVNYQFKEFIQNPEWFRTLFIGDHVQNGKIANLRCKESSRKGTSYQPSKNLITLKWTIETSFSGPGCDGVVLYCVHKNKTQGYVYQALAKMYQKISKQQAQVEDDELIDSDQSRQSR